MRFIGRISKLTTSELAYAPAARGRAPYAADYQRPIWIGCSIGHPEISAGTLGCFVKHKSGNGPVMILSNNHVLANENRAAEGDAVLQPGPADYGQDPKDAVARLAEFVRLEPGQTNLVDCAVATLNGGIGFVADCVDQVPLKGVATQLPARDSAVSKRGRTTLARRGRVTAFNIDEVMVGYETANLRFDDQIEIEGEGSQAFSLGGDSGSLVIDEDGRAVALLFASSETGGANGLGRTYANPIQTVLDKLNINLFLGA